MTQRYAESGKHLKRALKSIPLGSQTFSKSITQYPLGVSPLYIEKGAGSKVLDVDGNEYIDFVNSLASITLGYCDKDVDQAVLEQLRNGVTFSLPHKLEVIVAEKIINLVPSAEKVRFGKNGSDATSGAIRIARAFTERDHVAVCGYHGWQDWYIGSTTRNLGVPYSTQELTHKFQYNDIESLKFLFDKNKNKIAAVIMEPMNVEFPKDGFLENVKKLAHENGAVLIFDETITGFRFAKGGAQEYFNVIPDLSTFGKGLANGYALSAIVGRNNIMKKMEDVFFSGTFGGETLSLAAANAVLDKIVSQDILTDISEKGVWLLNRLNKFITNSEFENYYTTAGHPSWSFLLISEGINSTDYEMKTLFLQEMFKRGILTLGSHNLSSAHSYADLEKLMTIYEEVLPILVNADRKNIVKKLLDCSPLAPLFKVR
jgi:glutamate-1-semialdehyde 2,1-aminomutase